MTLNQILNQMKAQEKRLLAERDKINQLLGALDFKCGEIDDACEGLAEARRALQNVCDDLSKSR